MWQSPRSLADVEMEWYGAAPSGRRICQRTMRPVDCVVPGLDCIFRLDQILLHVSISDLLGVLYECGALVSWETCSKLFENKALRTLQTVPGWVVPWCAFGPYHSWIQRLGHWNGNWIGGIILKTENNYFLTVSLVNYSLLELLQMEVVEEGSEKTLTKDPWKRRTEAIHLPQTWPASWM